MDAGHQASLAELTRSVLAGTAMPTLRWQVVTLASRVLAVEASAIWELVPDQSSLVLQAGVGWQEDTVGRATVEAGMRSPLGYAVQTSTLVTVSEWQIEPRFDQPSLLRDRGVTSSLYVAIEGPSLPVGILGVDTAARRIFTSGEMHFLQMVAHVLALAIDRVQLNEALDKGVEVRTRNIEQRLVAAAQDKAILEERQRLARELHDSVTQSLYSITLHAQAAQRLLIAGDAATAATNLRELQDRAQEALDEMRLLIFELRPPVLEQVGLVAALQARLNAVEGRANLRTKLIVEGVDRLPPAVEEALYRISQEALNNALRHAHAHGLTVQLRQVKATVMLDISDDGIGFDMAVARTAGGQGLRGIEERVAQLGGQLTVESALGAGTKLHVEIVA